ncbi:glycerophosphodiester phosphodiesterase [Streptomyces roseoverticillatus]|uniref:glycerophosphodiester phosphodiesterase family protein n=1 Tax=Streptomyces roseoverticillatus TaxID=66429 RepID=UPI001F31C21E|nr:glycerophosphodiester phosphodiesterase family protein [Streptomyces roseoverticillatus]MCF3102286.1 glycerophosphodiester phosphodiesterase [Streptomyces roseoverticillatus]
MPRRLALPAAIAVLACAVPALTAGSPASARTGEAAAGFTRAKPLVIAHRAGTSDAPENTLEAVEQSLKAGVDGEWLSVQATRDDVPVLYRPADLSALTDGSGAVADKDLSELATLNAGYQFKDATGAYPYRTRPVRIPTLAAALDAVPANKQVYLDLKQAPARHVVDAVVRVLDAKKAWGRVKLYSTDAEITALLAKVDGAQVAESRDATRQRLAEIALEHTCKSTPPAGSWAGFELKRQMVLQEKFTLGTGESPVTAQLWTREAVACFRSASRRTPIMMLGVNTQADLRTATRLGATAVLVDSPRHMVPSTN